MKLMRLRYHTLLHKKSQFPSGNLLFVAGYNENGELGLGHYDFIAPAIQHPDFEPDEVELIASVVSYSYGASFILKTDGTIGGTGDNRNGELGLPNIDYYIEFTQESRGDDDGIDVDFHYYGMNAYALKSDGTLGVSGYLLENFLEGSLNPVYYKFTKVDGIENIIYMDCGPSGIIVIDSDGKLYAMGGEGDTGLGSDFNDNPVGESGSGLKYSNYYPTHVSQFGSNVSKAKIGESVTAVILKDGTLWIAGWGAGQYGLGQDDDYDLDFFEQEITYSNDGVDVDIFDGNILAIKSNGTLGGAGDNYAACLGLGHYNEINILTQLNDDTDGKKVYKLDGSICYAIKEDDTLGLSGTQGNYLNNRITPYCKTGTQVPDYTYSDISANIDNILTLVNGESSYSLPPLPEIPDNPQIYGLSRNGYGELGLGYYEAKQEMTPIPHISSNIKYITANGRASYLITTTGEIGAAGFVFIKFYPEFTQIFPEYTGLETSGYYREMVFLRNDGTLWIFDDSAYNDPSYHERVYQEDPDISDLIQFTSDSDGTNISTAYKAYFAGKGDDLYAGGYNGAGDLYRLGIPTDDGYYTTNPTYVGEYKQVEPDINHTLYLKSDNTLGASGSNDYCGVPSGIGPTTIQIGSDTYIDISTGANYSLAIKSNGTLWATGSNYNGQLGLGFISDSTPYRILVGEQVGTDNDWLQVSAIGTNSFGLKTDGTLGAGGNRYTENPVLIDNGPFTSISKIGKADGDDPLFGIKSI